MCPYYLLYICPNYPSLHVLKVSLSYIFPSIVLYMCLNTVFPHLSLCPNYPSIHGSTWVQISSLPYNEFKLFFPTCVCSIFPSLHVSRPSPLPYMYCTWVQTITFSYRIKAFIASGEQCRPFIYFLEMMESDFESWRSTQGLYQRSRSSPCIEVYVLHCTWRKGTV